MGILSSSVAVTRYLVLGKPKEPFLENVREALARHAVRDIDGQTDVKTVGWAGFEKHFASSFDPEHLATGEYLAFCLRVDKKSLPGKVVRKNMSLAAAKKLAETNRQFLAKEEKKDLREQVEAMLLTKIPAVPSVYDVLWDLTEDEVWLFSTQKAAKEEFETLFNKSFGLALVPLFPYTLAENKLKLSVTEMDKITALAAK
ncbi:MAG: recombination-associated protein RdgC [Thermodesulfobacteriota bacterium]